MAESEPTADMEPDAQQEPEAPPDATDPFTIAAQLGPGPDETFEEKQGPLSDYDKKRGDS
jgi:hypothetical protein